MLVTLYTYFKTADLICQFWWLMLTTCSASGDSCYSENYCYLPHKLFCIDETFMEIATSEAKEVVKFTLRQP